MTRHRIVAAAVAGLPVVAALFWFGTPANSVDKAAPAPAAPQVLAAETLVRPLARTAAFTGTSTAVETVELRPRVSGFVTAVSVPEGGMVQQGQILFTLDRAPFAARLAAARAASQEAAARLALAQAELGRATRLGAQGVVAQERVDQATAALAEREAQLAAARAAERLAALDLSHTQVKAPISGRVGKIEVTRGNLVATGETARPLTSIVSVDPLRVEFAIDETTYLAALAQARRSGRAPSLPVAVQLDDGQVRQARLDFLGNRLDRSTGTIPARALMRNPDHSLTPGLFARVSLALGAEQPTVLINDLAVGVEQGQRYVLTLDPANVVQRRIVRLGGTVDGLRIVEAGLQPGDRVILKGLVGPGMKVSPRMIPMAANADTKSGDRS